MPSEASVSPTEPDYVLWPYTGCESVIFYPPGSIEEHLVIEHGIDSQDVRRQRKGHRHHAHDHSKRAAVHLGEVGDLPAVGHAHEDAA
jgi:hypothetical protein